MTRVEIKPVPARLELEDEHTPHYCDIIICYDGAPVISVLNADSVECNVEEGAEDDIDAEARATAKKIILAYNAHDELLAAAEKVLADLTARIATAPGNKVPLFDGIGELYDAICKAKGECE